MCGCAEEVDHVYLVPEDVEESSEEDSDIIVNWLGHKEDEKFDTPNKDFKKIDQILPRKPGDRLNDRHHNIDSALDCMRNGNISLDELKVSPDKFDQLPSLAEHLRSESRTWGMC